MKRFVVTMMTAAMLIGVAGAQDKVDRRRENQQDRIANGVKNGTLQPGEAAKIEGKEQKINKEIRTERKANGGNLTNNEKKQINRQQNRVSKQIYKDKHNEK